MRRAAALVCAVALAAAGYVALRPSKSAPRPLLVYCGAALRGPVEAAAKAYEAETGTRVDLQFGPSQTLLANAELSRAGDLYIPADESYVRMALRKNLAGEVLPIGRMTLVLAVPKGNPKKVAAFADLLRADVKVAQANPEAAAVGKLTREKLAALGRWDDLKAKTAVFKPTVQDVANDLKLGSIDAGFVWDVTVRQYPELEAVELAELRGVEAALSLCALRSAADPAAALRFGRWLASKDRGLREFEKAGFRVARGDAWAPEPELRLYAGAMLRPALEDTIREFELREGIRVTRVYNGCGILVAGMKTGEVPDVYFSCDEQFMKDVAELFEPAAAISENQLVILVKKGNPRGVKRLRDLGQPGLRVGVGHEKQCALGALTQKTLEVDGTLHAVMKNVVTRVPAGDMLVNQLKAGGLDAAVAYVSNAASSPDALEAYPVDVPCAFALQPVAVAKDSPRAELARRLIAAFSSERSKARFLSEGFRWKAGP
jgi:molybdate transport system substrate-binding protein